MTSATPLVVVIAGPNAAGKSTTAPHLLQSALGVEEFVNADAIAAGLSAFRPSSVAFAAGRPMLERMAELARARRDFAFETTLASRSLAPWLRRWRASGYHAHLAVLALPSAEMAVARVAERVGLGGHDVPEEVVRRRFSRGMGNFFALYRNLVDTWQVYENSSGPPLRLIADGTPDTLRIADLTTWEALQKPRP